MELTTVKLKQILTGCKKPELWTNLINEYCDHFTKTQLAMFIAQCGHESGEFNVLQENLNYSRQGLLTVFKKYFNIMNVDEYARKPEKIANRVYADRMGNGSESSGDGWKYRGRGLLQVTGKASYAQCSVAVCNGDPNVFLDDPTLLIEPEYAIQSALWYWKLRGLLDVTDMTTMTRKINGGTNGLAARIDLYERAMKIL